MSSRNAVISRNQNGHFEYRTGQKAGQLIDMSTPATEFVLFPNLSSEVQLIIWEKAVDGIPRKTFLMVSFDGSCDIYEFIYDSKSPFPVEGSRFGPEHPALRHVCRDAEKAFLKHYVFGYGYLFQGKPNYIRPDKDTVYVEEDFLKEAAPKGKYPHNDCLRARLEEIADRLRLDKSKEQFKITWASYNDVVTSLD